MNLQDAQKLVTQTAQTLSNIHRLTGDIFQTNPDAENFRGNPMAQRREMRTRKRLNVAMSALYNIQRELNVAGRQQDKTKLAELIAQAQAAAKSRGHAMGKIGPQRWPRPGLSASAECKHCAAHFKCLTQPHPNEIEIGGSAVAVNCSRIKAEGQS